MWTGGKWDKSLAAPSRPLPPPPEESFVALGWGYPHPGEIHFRPGEASLRESLCNCEVGGSSTSFSSSSSSSSNSSHTPLSSPPPSPSQVRFYSSTVIASRTAIKNHHASLTQKMHTRNQATSTSPISHPVLPVSRLIFNRTSTPLVTTSSWQISTPIAMPGTLGQQGPGGGKGYPHH